MKVSWVAVLLIGLSAVPAIGQEPPAVRQKDYSAQRKPRLAVTNFENTNTEAQQRKYGESVSAMLVTHLKRHSQLVAVERQREQLLQEWRRSQSGLTAGETSGALLAPPPAPVLPPGAVPTVGPTPAVPTGAAAPVAPGLGAVTVPDPAAALAPLVPAPPPLNLRLLQSVDAILDGRVTVLASCQQGTGPANSNCTSGSDEIEIDARLVSTDDGHIISVGHQRGKAAQLRDIVAALGVELENGFLRPYYGSLTVTVPEPSNVRIWLTPVLAANASDDEKPPVELDRSVTNQAQSRAILLDKWVTSPTVVTISNLLVGWYTIKLERPGYEGVSTDNARIILPQLLGQTSKPVRVDNRPLTPEQESFLVYISPGSAQKWPADGRRVALRKKGGSLLVQVKREFLDRDFRPASEVFDLKTFVRADLAQPADKDSEPRALLEVNSTDDFETVADGPFSMVSVVRRLNLRTTCEYRVAQPMFDQFTGGRLLLEDYHQLATTGDRRLPVGQYRLYAVHKNYVPLESGVVDVSDGEADRPVQVELRRMRGTIEIEHLGAPAPGRVVILEGIETKFRQSFPLDFSGKRTIPNMPVDSYTVRTDLPGFDALVTTLPVQEVTVTSRANDNSCEVALPDSKDQRPWNRATQLSVFSFTLKSQPWLGGRLSRMKRFPDDRRTVVAQPGYERLLDQLTKSRENQPTSGAALRGSSSLVVGSTAGAEAREQDAVKQLRDYLWQIDLLYLDDSDMDRLLRLPEAAAVIRDYIDKGGAVFAFVSKPGNYASILGQPINIDPKRRTMRDELLLRPGDVSQVQLDMKIEFRPQREFPTLEDPRRQPLAPWRVLAYRRGGRNEPAIIEMGELEKGGFAVVWLDSLEALPQDGPAGDVVNEALAAIENRAFAWAQYLMYRRHGPTSTQRQDANDKLAKFTVRMNKEAKVLP